MMLPSYELDARGLVRLCSLGWMAFVATLVGGGLATAVSVLKVEPQTYKRAIDINLAEPQTEKGQHNGYARPPACDLAFGLRNDKDVLPQFERDTYAQVIQQHRLSELGVTEFRIFDRGTLAFRVGVTINPDGDSRITRLIEDFNVARSGLVQALRERIKETEKQSEVLASSIDWINALKGEAASQLADYLRRELECRRYELLILESRMQDSSSPISLPDIRKDLTAASPLKTLATCLFATLMAAFLAALLTGYIRLSRQLRSTKPDVETKS